MQRTGPGGRAWQAGEQVRITSLTDVDTKLPQTPPDTFNLIGRLAVIQDPYINDYYDLTIRLLDSSGIPGTAYGTPAILAFLYCDLEPYNGM
jgi:hypothetical protein